MPSGLAHIVPREASAMPSEWHGTCISPCAHAHAREGLWHGPCLQRTRTRFHTRAGSTLAPDRLSARFTLLRRCPATGYALAHTLTPADCRLCLTLSRHCTPTTYGAFQRLSPPRLSANLTTLPILNTVMPLFNPLRHNDLGPVARPLHCRCRVPVGRARGPMASGA